jgi:Fe-S-cluster containining protein
VSKLRVLYDCNRCPAHCCAYPLIELTPADVRRLARHFDLAEPAARERFTKPGGDRRDGRLMRHKKDPIFGTACQFLDRETRQCTIYDARPGICRHYPGLKRCGFWEFLKAERIAQDDPDYVPDFMRR